MSDKAAAPTKPSPPPGVGGILIMAALMILPAVVSYECIDKVVNTAVESHQCNAVFCFNRKTEATHRDVTKRGGQEVGSETVYYCADHKHLAVLELWPRLWRLVVWLFVAVCNLITLVVAAALVMKGASLFQGKKAS